MVRKEKQNQDQNIVLIKEKMPLMKILTLKKKLMKKLIMSLKQFHKL